MQQLIRPSNQVIMGTSHRHKPAGNPNWGKTSNSVTQIANNIVESKKLDNNPPTTMTTSAIEKRQAKIGNRVFNHYRSSVRNLVRSAGGRKSVASGVSKVMGRSGVYYANAFTSTFQDIAQKGLNSWLKDHGILSIEGKTTKEVLDILSNFMDDYFTGIDDTAAREALEAVKDKVAKSVEQNNGDFDTTIQEIVSGEIIKDYLDEFFGVYIYSHLSQSFFEKIQKEKGYDIAIETMQEIRDLIIDDVKRSYIDRPIGTIDWKGIEGKKFINEEFNRIIKILTNNED